MNELYSHRLRRSSPTAPVNLVVSAGQSPVACGTCRVVPSLAGAITVLLTTDSDGNAEVMTQLTDPSLRGLTLFEQWLTFRFLGATCAQFSLDMSNALRVVIE